MLTPESFDAHLAASGIWPPEGQIVVGYSGGADSTCLLHLLVTGGHPVIAGHLHHGMRPQADQEQKLCAAFAETLGIPFAAGRADVPALAEEQGVGLEEAGRIARYIFLKQTANSLNAVAIATGHTLTDHAETVLMHVVRGSGRRGLGGIEAKSGDLLRPLLAFSREQTRAYCDAHNLWYHDDPANADDKFLRSRLRNRVFPILRDINPSVEQAIARLADVMREEDAFLDGAAAASLERLEVLLNGELNFLTHDREIALDLHHFRHVPKPLMRRAVRLCFETLGSSLDFHQTEILVEQLMSANHGSLTSEGGTVIADWDGDRLFVVRPLHLPAFTADLEVPGAVEGDDWGWCLTASEEPYDGQSSSRSGLVAYLDRAALGGKLVIRSLQAGDRMQPLGFSGTRKIADQLSEAKLTKAARAVLPLVEDKIGPVWVPGVSLADRAKVNSGTKHVIKLVIGPARRGESNSH